LGEFFLQVLLHVKEVEVLEVAERAAVEKQQERDDFAVRDFHRAISTPFAIARLELEIFVLKGEFLAKIVCDTENFRNFVFGK
jgi:hypothetical protein